jgi:DNA-binding transcriptional MerR regulator
VVETPLKLPCPVGVLARLAGVTVRTLHHYDEIGLLSPSKRSAKGYRLYGHEDLLRLQQILIRRELGMSLEQIRRALDEPGFDLRATLLEQRAELEARRDRADQMLRSIDAAIAAIDRAAAEDSRFHQRDQKQENVMNFRELFDGFDPADYEDEAKARWGQTEAYAESARRTAKYGPEDWKRMKAEADEINREFAQLFSSGAPADGEAARTLAERHRLHIDRWFYPCAHQMHVGLGRMYVADERFAANYEKYAVGLTAYIAAAIEANAAQSTNEG